MKRVIAILLTALMLIGLCAGCGSSSTGAGSSAGSAAGSAAGSGATTEKALKMCMITDAGGLGDNGFNDMAWAGMEQARDELGYEIGIVESTEAAQYASNISAAADQGYDVIVCVGYMLEDPLKEVAPQYPDTKFIMIDGSVEGDNVYSFIFEMQECSFLAGALAATVQSDSKTFGCVGGMEIPAVISWESGFIAGVKAINPEAQVLVSYVGSFADPGKAKELALSQFNQGASAVMEISSGGAIGVIEAAKDSGKKFIATDKSKDDQAPGCELTAAIAGRDAAVFAAAKAIKEGTAQPGTTNLKMADGVYSLASYTEEKYGADVQKMVEDLQQKIIDGTIVVPNSIEEANAFQPLNLG